MKMKRLLVYLSVIALLQIILVESTGSYFEEAFAFNPNLGKVMVSQAASIITFAFGTLLYTKLFNETR